MQSPDPAKRRAHGQRIRARLRYRVLSHYSSGAPACACCGESHLEFLSLDHIDGGGNLHRKAVGGGSHFYLHLQREGFPPGYRVPCHNCNLAMGYYGYCPHAEPDKSALAATFLIPRPMANRIAL